MGFLMTCRTCDCIGLRIIPTLISVAVRQMDHIHFSCPVRSDAAHFMARPCGCKHPLFLFLALHQHQMTERCRTIRSRSTSRPLAKCTSTVVARRKFPAPRSTTCARRITERETLAAVLLFCASRSALRARRTCQLTTPPPLHHLCGLQVEIVANASHREGVS